MGRDAFVHISRADFSEKSIEKFIIMMGFQKRNGFYVCRRDDDYKYYSPVYIYKMQETETERVYTRKWIRQEEIRTSYP